jgi:hypothetical protein
MSVIIMYDKVVDVCQGVKTVRAEKKSPKAHRREGKFIIFYKFRYIEFNRKVSVLLLSTTSHSIRPVRERRWFNLFNFLNGLVLSSTIFGNPPHTNLLLTAGSLITGICILRRS